MRTTVAALALVCALAVFAAPAAAESGVVTLTGGQETTVATMSLGAGDVVEWTYSSGGSVAFTIDRQGSGEVFASSTMVGTGTFTAPSAGTYVFAFANTGGSLTIVSYDLQRKSDPTMLLILGGVGALAAVGIIAAIVMARRKKAAGMPPAMPPQAPPPPPPR